MCRGRKSTFSHRISSYGLRLLLGIDERNVGKYGGVEITVDFLKRNSRGKILELGYRLVFRY